MGFFKCLALMSIRVTVGQTPLHWACAHDNPAAVLALLQMPGIFVNSMDIEGNSPIMEAAKMCSRKSLEIMLADPRVEVVRRVEEIVGKTRMTTLEEMQEMRRRIKEERLKRMRAQKMEDPICTLKWIVELNQKIEEIGKSFEEKEETEMKNMMERHSKEVTNLKTKLRKQAEDEQKQLKLTLQHLVKDLENLNAETENTEDRDDIDIGAAREELKCPVCLEMMEPPTRIWMCSNTHLVCDTCKQLLEHNRCPSCRSAKINKRAFFAENMARVLFTGN